MNTKKTITRREFLRGSAAFLTTSALAASVVPFVQAEESTGADSRYEKIVVGISADPKTLVPWDTGSGSASYVADLEKSIRFYSEILGMSVMERFPQKDGSENVFLDGGAMILELMYGTGLENGLDHIAVDTEDHEEALCYFREKEVPVIREHVIVEDTIHLADVLDPDGNCIRLFRREMAEE